MAETTGGVLAGRHALITGGSRGIGRGIALEFAREGADVTILYAQDETAANQTCSDLGQFGVRARSYCCDISAWDQTHEICEAVVGELGRVDILVNNAGIVRDNLFLRMKEAEIDEVLGVNLKGTMIVTRQLLRSLLGSPYGRVITISSVIALMGNIGQANYAAAKAGLIGFTKALARELAGRQVTCNVIAPGFIATDMTAGLTDEMTRHLIGLVALKRVGTVEDVAQAAAFLASDKASYITGQVLQVDGGMHL